MAMLVRMKVTMMAMRSAQRDAREQKKLGGQGASFWHLGYRGSLREGQIRWGLHMFCFETRAWRIDPHCEVAERGHHQNPEHEPDVHHVLAGQLGLGSQLRPVRFLPRWVRVVEVPRPKVCGTNLPATPLTSGSFEATQIQSQRPHNL